MTDAAPAAEPDADGMVACAGPECSVRFKPQRRTARYHSGTCRQRAARAKKAAAESVEADVDAGKEDHPLVKAVRAELAKVDREDTFNGQLALQLARKLTNPDESGSTALSKELRAVMTAALAGAGQEQSPATAPVEDDEITRAREARERKAREAASRA